MFQVRRNSQQHLTIEQRVAKVFDTAKKVNKFFDQIPESLKIPVYRRAVVALVMSANYQREPIIIESGLNPFLKGLSDIEFGGDNLYKDYGTIRMGIEEWARINLFQEVVRVRFGDFEPRYFDAIFALFEIHAQAKMEEISTEFSQRFENELYEQEFNGNLQCQLSDTDKISEPKEVLNGFLNTQIVNKYQQIVDATKNFKNDGSLVDGVEDQHVDQVLCQYEQQQWSNGYLEEENSELSEMDDLEAKEYIKTPVEVARENLVREIMQGKNMSKTEKRSKKLDYVRSKRQNKRKGLKIQKVKSRK
eukprot:TRINITY_DN5143_c0_g1_i11.p1 TRINITY_DN5143_c0_g1~~TRINITY_DN5143_c0_g1_i11.p1  ORF type:complete len:305 (-),score=43.44 TRINITY_DN5143_c0_g1_i11:490-1404(-)